MEFLELNYDYENKGLTFSLLKNELLQFIDANSISTRSIAWKNENPQDYLNSLHALWRELGRVTENVVTLEYASISQFCVVLNDTTCLTWMDTYPSIEELIEVLKDNEELYFPNEMLSHIYEEEVNNFISHSTELRSNQLRSEFAETSWAIRRLLAQLSADIEVTYRENEIGIHICRECLSYKWTEVSVLGQVTFKSYSSTSCYGCLLSSLESGDMTSVDECPNCSAELLGVYSEYNDEPWAQCHNIFCAKEYSVKDLYTIGLMLGAESKSLDDVELTKLHYPDYHAKYVEDYLD